MPLCQLAAIGRRLRCDANGAEQRLWRALRANWQARSSAAKYFPHLTLTLSAPKDGEGNVEASRCVNATGHDPAIHGRLVLHGWRAWSQA